MEFEKKSSLTDRVLGFLIFHYICGWIFDSIFNSLVRLFGRDASPTERLTILSAYSLLSLGIAWGVFFLRS